MNSPTKEDLLKAIAEKKKILEKKIKDAKLALKIGSEIQSEARGMLENLEDEARLQLRDPSQPINHSSLERANEM